MARIGIERIGQVAVNVRDLERALAFYRDALELRFLFQAPPKMAFFDCGGVRLMLSLPETADLDHPGSILYLTVPDIHAAHQALAEKGVAFVAKPHLVARLEDHDLYLAEFHDSEGNPLALMGEVPRA
jgi:catechol 2,3-dioxygenase-like lactoylglutathione lyase family enzyme